MSRIADDPLYAVWRRQPDGHVGGTVGVPSGWSYYDRETLRPVKVTFEVLLESDDWPECLDKIIELRGENQP